MIIYLGRHFIDAVKLKKRHSKLQNEMEKYKPTLTEVMDTADELMHNDHFAKEAIKKEKENVSERWKVLETVAAKREKDLDNSIMVCPFAIVCTVSSSTSRKTYFN